MDTMDICSIFGNALDNAIESVIEIKEKEKKRTLFFDIFHFVVDFFV